MDPALAVSVKNRVRELRMRRGWSQIDLGGHLQVSRQTINAIENMRYDPSLPLALAIAKLFGEPVESVFGEDDLPEDVSEGEPCA
jgi:putative transcriptional regulator